MEDLHAATGARSIERGETIQSLWGGYGEIFRARLVGAVEEAVVVKRVEPPTAARHPRGWTSSRSHERKLRSYDVELAFYRSWAPRLGSTTRTARCLASGRGPTHPRAGRGGIPTRGRCASSRATLASVPPGSRRPDPQRRRSALHAPEE